MKKNISACYLIVFCWMTTLACWDKQLHNQALVNLHRSITDGSLSCNENLILTSLQETRLRLLPGEFEEACSLLEARCTERIESFRFDFNEGDITHDEFDEQLEQTDVFNERVLRILFDIAS